MPIHFFILYIYFFIAFLCYTELKSSCNSASLRLAPEKSLALSENMSADFPPLENRRFELAINATGVKSLTNLR